jgi:hypothetical protein
MLPLDRGLHPAIEFLYLRQPFQECRLRAVWPKRPAAFSRVPRAVAFGK